MGSKDNGKVFAWVVFCGCIVSNLMMQGIMAAGSSLFFPYMSEDLNIGYTELSVSSMIGTVVTAATMPICAKLIGKWDVRIIASGAVLLSAISSILKAFAHGLFMVYLSSIVGGISNAVLCGFLANILISNWFANGTGTLFGIATAFGGLGGAVAGPLWGKVLPAVGWRTTSLLMSAIVLVVMLPVTIWMTRLPKDDSERLQLQKENKNQAGVLKKKTFSEIKKLPVFYVFLFAGVFAALTTILQPYLSTHAMTLGYDIEIGALMLSAYMLCSGIGRVVVGIFLDVVNPVKAIAICALLYMVGFVGLITGDTKTVLIISSGLVGLTYALTIVVGPYLTVAIFGVENLPPISGISSLLSSLGGAMGGLLIGIVYDAYGNYHLALIVIGVVAALAAICYIYAFVFRKSTEIDLVTERK